MLKPGAVINGKYRVIRLIGDGGMGSVWEARHEILGSHVALKFLHPEIAKQAGLKERFLQEARVSATMQSPHICRVSDVDTADEGAYLVMDLLRGESLQALMDREPRLEVTRAVGFAKQILTGLQVAHHQGVVHRDLKPDNVFLVPEVTGPKVVLLDFGIAKLRHTEEYQMTLTRPGAVMGTPEYMAPEQAYSADLVDQRSDLFSVGVMLFEMLAGKRPAEGDNPQQIAEKIIMGHVEKLEQLRPDLPLPLVRLVHRAIEGNPDQRWPSADELNAALTAYAGLSSSVRTSQDVTGAATPFVPVSKTPVVDASIARGSQSPSAAPGHSDASTGSGLDYEEASAPPTVPPVYEGPPPSQLGKGSTTKTASMPEVSPALAVGAPQTVNHPPPAVGFGHSAPPGARKKAKTGVWLTLLSVFVLAVAGTGVVYYQLELAETATPPALPVLRVSPPASVEDYEIPGDLFGEEPTEAPDDARRPGSPRGNAPPGPVDELPKFPPITLPTNLPPITLPTNLPPIALPTSFPTALPTAFPFPVLPPAE